MNIIPVEIEHHLFSFLPLKDLVQKMLVSNHWLESIIVFLKLHKVTYFSGEILSLMVKKNSTMLDLLMDRFTVKQKSKICAYYAYYGDKEKIDDYLKNGAVWNDYCVNYAIYGGNQNLVDIYGSVNIGEHIPSLSMHVKHLNEKIENENDSIINHYAYHLEHNIYGDLVSQWLITRYEKYYMYQNILVMALMENNNEILEALKKCDFQLLESDLISIIKHGNWEMLQRAYSMYRICRIVSVEVLKTIVENGSFKMLQWIFQLEKEKKIHIPYFETDSLIITVSGVGKLDMLKWLIEEKIHDSKVSTVAILTALSGNHVHIVNHLIENQHYDPSILTVSARQIKMNHVSQIREIALKGNMETINFIIKYIPDIVSTLSKYMVLYGGNIEMFEYLLKNHDVDAILCSHCAATNDRQEFIDCIWKYHKDSIQIQWSSLMEKAIKNGNKNIVQWLIKHQPEDINLKPFISQNPVIGSKYKKCHTRQKSLLHYRSNIKVINLIKSYIK